VTDIEELLARIPTGQIAGRLGVDEATADAAIRQALPALVGGLHANAQDPAGAASLAGALAGHDRGLLDDAGPDGLDLDQVDTEDGDKIVGHVFGPRRDQVVDHLAAAGGPRVDSSLIARLLPMLAPIVMSFLAKRLLGGGGPGGVAGGSAGSGGGLGGILGDVLGSMIGGRGSGGSAGAGQGSAGGIDLGSILGGLGNLLGHGRR
jgi:hypothetical protein